MNVKEKSKETFFFSWIYWAFFWRICKCFRMGEMCNAIKHIQCKIRTFFLSKNVFQTFQHSCFFTLQIMFYKFFLCTLMTRRFWKNHSSDFQWTTFCSTEILYLTHIQYGRNIHFCCEFMWIWWDSRVQGWSLKLTVSGI